jgi:phosphoglycolate phosphatase-like HAD superfamily hydrolase
VKLVLFDIDGTLVWTDGAGRRAMTAALLDTFGGHGPRDYRYDGKTDRQIVRDLMRHDGHADDHIDGRLEALIGRYLANLENELRDVEPERAILPGVPAILDAVEARPDAVLGLLTGNVAEGARAKLRAVGIDPARFRVGAFGSDSEHRPELPAVAMRRARAALGIEVAAADVVVIGDTPADVECGRAAGARTIGVATGRYPAEELQRHGATAVIDSLADTAAVMRLIFDGDLATGSSAPHASRPSAR